MTLEELALKMDALGTLGFQYAVEIRNLTRELERIQEAKAKVSKQLAETIAEYDALVGNTTLAVVG